METEREEKEREERAMEKRKKKRKRNKERECDFDIYDGDIRWRYTRSTRKRERTLPQSSIHTHSIHGIQSMDWRVDTLTIGCDTSLSFHSIEFAFNSNLTYSIPNTPSMIPPLFAHHPLSLIHSMALGALCGV